MSKLSEVLEEFVIKEDCSYSELARRIGISNSQIIRYKNGVLPKFKQAIKIANYFKCSLNFLFGFSNDFKKLTTPLIFDDYNFINKYTNLLEQNKISHYELSKKIDICETSLTFWKKHNIPTTSAVLEIANYFSVSIDFLVCK